MVDGGRWNGGVVVPVHCGSGDPGDPGGLGGLGGLTSLVKMTKSVRRTVQQSIFRKAEEGWDFGISMLACWHAGSWLLAGSVYWCPHFVLCSAADQRCGETRSLKLRGP